MKCGKHYIIIVVVVVVVMGIQAGPCNKCFK